jgi:two-component system, OmpR family, sensor histidine kinase ChvG
MAPDTVSRKSDINRLRWSGRIPLTWRILAVNIIALALLAGGFSYIDSYRTRTVDARLEQSAREAGLLAAALENSPASDERAILRAFSGRLKERIRLYDAKGTLAFDSFTAGGPVFHLIDPDSEPLKRKIARFLDRVIDRIVGADKYPAYIEPLPDNASAWPELAESKSRRTPVAMARFAPDRTPMITSGVHLSDGSSILVSENARDITRIVRAERLNLGLVLMTAILASVLLSLFLARTIVLPLQRLANASVRVRLGRARQVTIPRLPDRRDEIGTLARAISDMTQALRQRIDATDAFAADVSHELKNPIASLRSALDGLQTVQQPELREQLFAIARDDVRRLDRLVTDIAEASRIDAQLSRTRFEPVDLGQMIETMILGRESRGVANGIRLAFARPRKDVAVVMGETQRLALVIDNLLDNAISFSPPSGLVQVTATVAESEVLVSVEDEGPGVPPSERETVFRRFHSVRPEGESFGKHSGLGLAIARSIVEGHQGRISIADRENAQAGARFDVHLPLAHLGDPGISSE